MTDCAERVNLFIFFFLNPCTFAFVFFPSNIWVKSQCDIKPELIPFFFFNQRSSCLRVLEWLGPPNRPSVYSWFLSSLSLVFRSWKSEGQLFNPRLDDWDHVRCGIAHPCCGHCLLSAEKQRWQVCRYAIATATRKARHGKRSVSL